MGFGRKRGGPKKPLRPVTQTLLGAVVSAGRKIVPEQERSAAPPMVVEHRPGENLPSPPVEPVPASVEHDRERRRQTFAEAAINETQEEGTLPDVFLDIPTIKVDEIKLLVENLDAKVALHAQLSNLVRIDVGANVSISKVDLDIKGVEAQALLKVRLKRVYEILARALETIDKNPQLLEYLVQPIGEAVRTVGDTAKESLGPGGAVSHAVKDVGETAKGVTAPEGPLKEAVKGVSDGVEGAIQGEFHETDEERRHLEKEKKSA